jgi:uncharacterized protein (DUF4415 family)
MPKPTRRSRTIKRSKRTAPTEHIVEYKPGMRGRTDWARLDRMTDAEIDQQIKADPDVAPEFDESWMANAEMVVPGKKEAVSLRLDPDVLAFFKAPGPGYQTRISAVLRSYVRANRRRGKARS